MLGLKCASPLPGKLCKVDFPVNLKTVMCILRLLTVVHLFVLCVKQICTVSFLFLFFAISTVNWQEFLRGNFSLVSIVLPTRK